MDGKVQISGMQSPIKIATVAVVDCRRQKSYARQSGSDMLLSQADFGLGGSRKIHVGRQNKLPLDFAQINLYMSLGEIKLLSY